MFCRNLVKMEMEMSFVYGKAFNDIRNEKGFNLKNCDF